MKKSHPVVRRKDERITKITVEGKLPSLGHGVTKRSGAGIHGGSAKRRNRRDRQDTRRELRQEANTDH